MTFTLLNHAVISTHIASVHRTGCKDIQREKLAHSSQTYGPYETVDAALAEYIDAEMVEMGYDRADVKVFGCCK